MYRHRPRRQAPAVSREGEVYRVTADGSRADRGHDRHGERGGGGAAAAEAAQRRRRRRARGCRLRRTATRCASASSSSPTPMTPEPRRVAVLGGTFDPVHHGPPRHRHRRARCPRRRRGVAGAGARPGAARRAGRSAAPAPCHARDRRARHPRPARRRRRAAPPGVSYTIDTLEALRATHPADEPWWVVGADAVRHIHEWHRSDELLGRCAWPSCSERARPASTPRRRAPGARQRAHRGPRRHAAAVSATEVRRRVARGESIGGWCPAPVADIIAASGLYRSAPVR